jgi:hypothetical protein
MHTKQEHDALTLRAAQLIAINAEMTVVNVNESVERLITETGISRERAHRYIARAARIVRGIFVRGSRTNEI